MNLVKPYQKITYKVGATNYQLQRAIEAALPAATEQMKGMSKQFKGATEKQTCRNIFDFLMQNIHYKVDGDNQKIKLPSAFLREKEGDCKSYSLFTASILANLKIPFSFTYASYNPTDNTPEHIYVTTKQGCIIDAVWGKFNSEKKPSYKFHKPMNISYISGINERKQINKYDSQYHLPKSLGKCYSPAIGAASKSLGIGRTGWDWAKAVGIDNSYSQAKWEAKRIANWVPREVSLIPFRKNAGGIANMFWALSPFNDRDREDTTKKALYFGELATVTEALMKKYNVADEKSAYNPSPAGTVITTETFKPSYVYRGPLVVEYKPTNNGNTFTPEIKYAKQFYDAASSKATNYTKELEAAKLRIYAKYPYIISRASTPEMQKKYRDLEIWWFWTMGGSPDDLNEAIKEGNTKTPTGETFNYYITEKLKGRDLGIGLGLRASISAMFGVKYDPDTKKIGVAAEVIGAIIAWVGMFPVWVQAVIGILLTVGAILLAFVLLAPDWTSNALDLNNPTNGSQGNITPQDPEIKTDMLAEQDSMGMLLPVGIAAAVLFLVK
jgi:hypothetical protein